MARRRRRAVRRGRKAAPRRVVRRRRRATMRHNPPRHYRRRRAVRRSRRSYRRNPSLNLAGLNIGELLKGAGAVILSPMLEKHLMPMLPATVSGTTYGRWAVKLGAALGVWYGAKAAFGRRSADVVAIALGSSIIADAIQEFMPTLGLSAYTPVGMRGYVPVSRGLRGLGMVTQGGGARTSGFRSFGPSTGTTVGALRAGAPVGVFDPPF